MVAEAARAAGSGHRAGRRTFGRPVGATIPEALRSVRAVTSLGGIGSHVCTGPRIVAVVGRLETAARANRELEKDPRARRASL